MQKSASFFFACVLVIAILTAGCIGGDASPAAETTSVTTTDTTVPTTAVPATTAHCYFNPYTGACQDSPVTSLPTTAATTVPTTTRTPAPTAQVLPLAAPLTLTNTWGSTPPSYLSFTTQAPGKVRIDLSMTGQVIPQCNADPRGKYLVLFGSHIDDTPISTIQQMPNHTITLPAGTYKISVGCGILKIKVSNG